MRTGQPMYRLSNALDDFFNDRFIPAFNTIQGQMYLASDVEESDTNYIITVDLPGVEKERVEVEVTTKQVNIRVKEASQNQSKKYLIKERITGVANRVYRFNEVLDADNTNAEYKNGVLVLVIPKKNHSTKKILTFTE